MSFPVADVWRPVGCWEHFVFRSDGGVDDMVGWHTGECPVPDEWRLVGCWEHFVFRSDGGVDDMVGWHTGEFPGTRRVRSRWMMLGETCTCQFSSVKV